MSEGNKIIPVPKHKRTKDGPAMLGMDAELQKNMEVYVYKIRPQFAISGEQKLFIKDNGEGFPEGTIGKRLSAFFTKSGVTNKRIAHTTLRKFITTQTYQHGNSREGEEVQKVMSHTKTTSRCCYLRQDLTKAASQAMTVIARVTKPPDSEEDKEEEEDQGQAENCPSPEIPRHVPKDL